MCAWGFGDVWINEAHKALKKAVYDTHCYTLILVEYSSYSYSSPRLLPLVFHGSLILKPASLS